MKQVILFSLLCSLTLFAEHFIEISGEFETIDQATPVVGTFSIIDSVDGKYLKLNHNFIVADGPDLHILLSPHTLEEATNSNATDGALIVASLQKRIGEQIYKLPHDIDLELYHSVLIHCIEYSHLFGGAPLLYQDNSVVVPERGVTNSNILSGGVTIDVRGRVVLNRTIGEGVYVTERGLQRLRITR